MSTYTVAITGASGAPYGLKLLETLIAGGPFRLPLHLGEGQAILHDEAGLLLKGSETDIQNALERHLKAREGQLRYLTRRTCTLPSRAAPRKWMPWS